MKRIAPIIVLLVCLHYGGGETYAQCDCGYGNPDLATYLAHRDFKLADVVFVGKVTKVERVKNEDNDYDIVVTFAVSRAWKRNLQEAVSLRNFEGCDRGYKVGKEWLIYAYDRGDGTFKIDCCCSGTKLLSRADVDLKHLKRRVRSLPKYSKRDQRRARSLTTACTRRPATESLMNVELGRG